MCFHFVIDKFYGDFDLILFLVFCSFSHRPNTRTPAIVNALFNDHLSKSCEYRVLKNNESTSCDDQYISELFNHIEWYEFPTK